MRNLSNKSTEYLQCVECQVCATLPQSPTPRQPRAFRDAKISRRSSVIIGLSWSFFGHFLTNLANGERKSKNALCVSNVNCQSISRQNNSTILIPQVLDLIRHCGRRGDEQEARRLYLAYGVDFRAYRAAYKAGRQEARRMRIVQETKA